MQSCKALGCKQNVMIKIIPKPNIQRRIKKEDQFSFAAKINFNLIPQSNVTQEYFHQRGKIIKAPR